MRYTWQKGNNPPKTIKPDYQYGLSAEQCLRECFRFCSDKDKKKIEKFISSKKMKVVSFPFGVTIRKVI